MFLRIRWFILGAAASFGLFAYVAARLRRAREQMTPMSLFRGAAQAVADLLDIASKRISAAGMERD